MEMNLFIAYIGIAIFRICKRRGTSVSTGMRAERKSKIHEDALGCEGRIVDFNIMKCYS